MRETRKKWFVIETDVDGSWMDCTDCYTMGDAVQKALRIWEYAYSLKDRKHRRIEVALLWAVYDEDEEKWFPIFDLDEEYAPETMEGEYAGAYTPVLNLGVSED